MGMMITLASPQGLKCKRREEFQRRRKTSGEALKAQQTRGKEMLEGPGAEEVVVPEKAWVTSEAIIGGKSRRGWS